LVYKPSPKHTFRFGYNRAVGAPSQLQVNIDFPVSTIVPGVMDIWLVGNKNEQTFNNPTIELNSLLGGFPDLPIGTPGFPNAYTYGAVAEPTLAELIPGIAGALQAGGADEATANAVAGAIQGYLVDPANTPDGFSGNFFGYNAFNGNPLGVTNAPQAVLRKEDTWEFGYKGLIGNKLGVSLDIYNRKIDGNTLFTAISPTYSLVNPNLGADLGNAVATTELRDFIFTTLGGNQNPTAGPTADGLIPVINDAFAAGGEGYAGAIVDLYAIIGATPTDNVPANGITHIAAGYRTFEAYDYTGVDLGLEFYANENLSFYGNYSYISDNIFNPAIKGADGATETTSIAAPQNKVRLGANYTPVKGLRGNISIQYDESFMALLGQFSGDTGNRTVVDLGLGYKFNDTITFDISAQNVLDNEYRAYPLFPEIGRRVLAKLTFNFAGKG